MKYNLSQDCLEVGRAIRRTVMSSITAANARKEGSEADYQRARLEREREREEAEQVEDNQIINACCPGGGGRGRGGGLECMALFNRGGEGAAGFDG